MNKIKVYSDLNSTYPVYPCLLDNSYVNNANEEYISVNTYTNNVAIPKSLVFNNAHKDYGNIVELYSMRDEIRKARDFSMLCSRFTGPFSKFPKRLSYVRSDNIRIPLNGGFSPVPEINCHAWDMFNSVTSMRYKTMFDNGDINDFVIDISFKKHSQI